MEQLLYYKCYLSGRKLLKLSNDVAECLADSAQLRSILVTVYCQHICRYARDNIIWIFDTLICSMYCDLVETTIEIHFNR